MRAISLAALALVAGAVPPARAQGEFHWSGRLASGKRLEIKGVNGDIHAVGVTSGDVDVTARKHARRSDPESVEIKVVTTDDAVTICAVYPTPRRARHDNECTAGDHWSSSTEDNDVSVDFEVRVPAGVKFYGHTVNGGGGGERFGAGGWGLTGEGSVRPSPAGHAEATTVDGSLVGSLGRAHPS